MTLRFVYVCDEDHSPQLAISLASIFRYHKPNVFIIDYGLSCGSRDTLEGNFGVKFMPPAFTTPGATNRRIGAYREKTMAAARVAQAAAQDPSPIVLLDSDIIVTDGSFFQMAQHLQRSEVRMVRSAWDRDFTWTYKPEATSVIRELSGLTHFSPKWEVPNSGIVAGLPAVWIAISPVWRDLYDGFLGRPGWPALVNDYALPGDQEFLRLGIERSGCTWTQLHGSYNMQVSNERMTWSQDVAFPLRGGHLGEPEEVVRALHYSVDKEYSLKLSSGMLANQAARDAVAELVASLKKSIRNS